ncbi:NupC/NupG family nucleoside CNT transporter [Candidatus Odyssella thessalonicensis]|uniref:NupC/NupG family nucleoside CNT transporter n=1 Tax=Candidatus Odyssella thessalonicensis TaxID=84647 RepID=UPI000225A964|nr:nucleoside transporter C-terminal domain-containing protein [Candidatus Odyssella thessalonicensis]
MQSVIGIVVFLGFAWALSENRSRPEIKPVLSALALQFFLAIILMKFDLIREGLGSLTGIVEALKAATQQGTQFVFGYLGGGESPFLLNPASHQNTFIFALQALPMIMVVSALSMLLFHWRIMPLIVTGASWFLQRTLNIGGALGIAAGAKVLLGNIDAPLLIRPYLKNFSRSEMFAVMTCGMATTSATVMALYSFILKDTVANPIAHIIMCSIISIPAALAISRLMVPQGSTQTEGALVVPHKFTGWMDAVSKGTSDGLNIFLNIIAMLIVALALVYLANAILALLPNIDGGPLSLQRLFGYLFAPVTWLMGVPWHESGAAGALLGTKTVINEVVAFSDLAALPHNTLSPRTALIMTYALCGFANFSAVGIVIGGLGAMVPERREMIVSLGMKSVISGTLATCLSATLAGLLL